MIESGESDQQVPNVLSAKAARPRKPRALRADLSGGTAAGVVAAGEAAIGAIAPSVDMIAHTARAAPSPAVESDPIDVAADTAAHASEELTEMATIAPPTATETTDKAQALFGDFSERFKAAFEKSSKLGEDMVEFTKGNVEAMVASARVAAQASESLGQEAAAYGKKNFETATAAFKSFATVKSPTELFQLQSEFARAQFDSAVAEASKVSETVLKLAGEIAQPLSNRYALAAEKLKSNTL